MPNRCPRCSSPVIPDHEYPIDAVCAFGCGWRGYGTDPLPFVVVRQEFVPPAGYRGQGGRP